VAYPFPGHSVLLCFEESMCGLVICESLDP
jgi:hypothetical protein